MAMIVIGELLLDVLYDIDLFHQLSIDCPDQPKRTSQ